MVFHFRAVSPNTTSGAQAALMTTWQSCDSYLLPVNGLPHCLTFSLRLRSSFIFVPYFLFSAFFYLCFPSYFLPYCYCLLFCSFLFIGKAFLEPADYPRVLPYKESRAKICSALCVLSENFFPLRRRLFLVGC